MKFGVLKYPGGHGDAELVHILRQHFNIQAREVWYLEETYADLGALFLGGGFPCNQGVSGHQCLDQAPALRYLETFVNNGGYVIGVGNGFRLLCESGLLPGELRPNSTERFICKHVYIKAENHLNAITSGLDPEEVFRIPIATAYGNYEADEEVLVKMRQEGQILFRYCDYEGRITESVNETGAKDNIAGISNPAHTVFGLIPQPERAVSEFRRDADGKGILNALLQRIEK
jgi:phosphoribosylformylglycinamidine synthase